jgi:hypothetical protein
MGKVNPHDKETDIIVYLSPGMGYNYRNIT